jgi:hypothetical protein
MMDSLPLDILDDILWLAFESSNRRARARFNPFYVCREPLIGADRIS